MSAENIVERTGTPAFSRGADGAITAWNRGVAELFGVPAESVVGRKCHEVMAGRDLFGNDYCCDTCASWRMVSSNRRVRPYRLTVSRVEGRPIELRVSILPTHGPNGPELLHLLESACGSGVVAVFSDELDEEEQVRGRAGSALTRRELQVLRYLAVGYGTDEIAWRLMISRATVRNHVSACLQKLDVHSRVEAVAAARRLDLV